MPDKPKTKHTPVGEIPVEWECMKLREVIGGFESGTSVGGEDRLLSEGEIGVLRVSAVSEGIFRPDECKVVAPKDASRLSVYPRAGEIIVSRANTLELIGASVFVDRDWPDRFLPDKLWQTNLAHGEHVDTKWLSYILASSRARNDISGRATGTSGSMKNISQSAFLGVRIPLPPLPEQRKIAEILSTWDRAIEQTEKLIEAKKRLKKGLMQRLLTGKLRFPQFAGRVKSEVGRVKGNEWRTCRLGELLEEVKRPVKWDDDALYDLISIRRRSGGLFHRDSLYGHQIKTKNLRVARTGDFLISKMQVVHGATGLTTPEFDEMKISGSYIALVARDPNVLLIEFFDYLEPVRKGCMAAREHDFG